MQGRCLGDNLFANGEGHLLRRGGLVGKALNS
jgi:hypothetical protein